MKIACVAAVLAALEIASVAPPVLGPQGGPVTIAGLGFPRGARVFVGGREASGVEVHSANQINAVAPPGLSGPVTVTVEGGGEVSALPAALEYVGEGALDRIAREQRRRRETAELRRRLEASLAAYARAESARLEREGRTRAQREAASAAARLAAQRRAEREAQEARETQRQAQLARDAACLQIGDAQWQNVGLSPSRRFAIVQWQAAVVNVCDRPRTVLVAFTLLDRQGVEVRRFEQAVTVFPGGRALASGTTLVDLFRLYDTASFTATATPQE